MEAKKEVFISEELYKNVEKKLGDYGFKSVDEYVEFVVSESLKTEEVEYSKDEEEEVKKRLKDLGYID